MLCDTFYTLCCVQVAPSNQQKETDIIYVKLDNQLQEEEYFLSTLLSPKCSFGKRMKAGKNEHAMSIDHYAIVTLNFCVFQADRCSV